MNINRKLEHGTKPGTDQAINQEEVKIDLETDPLTALLADVKDADRVMRGLVAIGLDEDQIKMVSLESLLIELNP